MILVAGAGVLALAAPADLDTGFDQDGVRVIDYLGNGDIARSVVARPDGRILIAGDGNANADIAVQALREDGSGDPTLDAEGSLGIDLGGTDTGAALALMPDGRIVVAGTTSAGAGGSNDFVVLRRTADGAPDPSFQQRVIDYGGSDDRALDVALRPDGRIVAVGIGNANGDISVQGLLANGAGDPSLDGEGSLGIDLGGTDTGHGVALQPDGRIVVAATRLLGTDANAVVLRRLADGSPDPAFGGGAGLRTFEPGVEDVQDVVLQPDGRIVTIGSAGGDMVVRRLLPNGADDPSFDGDGHRTVDFSGVDDVGRAVALQADGKILVAGWRRYPSGARDMVVARIQPGGALDTTFSVDGRRELVLTPFDMAFAVTVDARGRIILGGFQAAAAGQPADLVVARLAGDPPPAPVGGAGGGGAPGAPGGGGGAAGAGPAGVARCAGRAPTIIGTTRSDRLRGTARRDVIVGLGGDDVIRGLRGDDVICGGRGRDVIDGGRGADRVIGGPGNDLLRGGPGRDTLAGQLGRDRCFGGTGRDAAVGCERRRGL